MSIISSMVVTRTTTLVTLACSTLLMIPLPGCAVAPTPTVRHLVEEAKQGTLCLTFSVESLQKTVLDKNDIPAALAYVRAHPDYTSYLLLLFLRRQVPGQYDSLPDSTKAAVLCSALGRALDCNDWTFLSPERSIDHVAGEALVQVGSGALPYLVPLLDDKRLAPWAGSIESAGSMAAMFRRCDLAYRYISLILGLNPSFDLELSERDLAIKSLEQRLEEEFGMYCSGPGAP